MHPDPLDAAEEILASAETQAIDEALDTFTDGLTVHDIDRLLATGTREELATAARLLLRRLHGLAQINERLNEELTKALDAHSRTLDVLTQIRDEEH